MHVTNKDTFMPVELYSEKVRIKSCRRAPGQVSKLDILLEATGRAMVISMRLLLKPGSI
jgi:hypothetical protein